VIRKGGRGGRGKGGKAEEGKRGWKGRESNLGIKRKQKDHCKFRKKKKTKCTLHKE